MNPLTKYDIFDIMLPMEIKYKDVGEKIRLLRLTHNKNLADISEAIKVDKSYLSKIENGLIRPSDKLIFKLEKYFSLSPMETNNLLQLAGFNNTAKNVTSAKSTLGNNEKEDIAFKDTNKQMQDKINITVKIPDNLPILYSDSIFVTGSPYGIVLDIAQRLGSTGNHNIVARVGISLNHCKSLLKVLSKKIIDTERLTEKIQKEESGNN